ncbi:DUF427 domain-containing protein [Carboxylicivirga sp. N1Y90]|uniref:DUF427 domain-containing protein n=1 Tax=Carboxylicivirga fragile TaxID=3417571 RepID=UPI003D32F308|nr:DUF427 domain-containing protein [Marinilabiliaceae bacterium N1Y90]
MKAIWNNTVIAESKETIIIEGNHYFPPASLNMEYFKPSIKHTNCHWKGQASYYTIIVDKEKNEDAAWFYPDPKELAKHIKGYIAFWRGVEVVE